MCRGVEPSFCRQKIANKVIKKAVEATGSCNVGFPSQPVYFLQAFHKQTPSAARCKLHSIRTVLFSKQHKIKELARLFMWCQMQFLRRFRIQNVPWCFSARHWKEIMSAQRSPSVRCTLTLLAFAAVIPWVVGRERWNRVKDRGLTLVSRVLCYKRRERWAGRWRIDKEPMGYQHPLD